VWFPVATLQLIEALVETLLALETPFPFVFALGGKMASLPDALVERVSASGRGLVCKFWVEQRAILKHAALAHARRLEVRSLLFPSVPIF
jgi:hypothetical protein